MLLNLLAVKNRGEDRNGREMEVEPTTGQGETKVVRARILNVLTIKRRPVQLADVPALGIDLSAIQCNSGKRFPFHGKHNPSVDPTSIKHCK